MPCSWHPAPLFAHHDWSCFLSGVIADLRAQLKASIASHETMQTQSIALSQLQKQMKSVAKLQQEHSKQARDIGSLKSQISASAERHRQLICQVLLLYPGMFVYMYTIVYTYTIVGVATQMLSVHR